MNTHSPAKFLVTYIYSTKIFEKLNTCLICIMFSKTFISFTAIKTLPYWFKSKINIIIHRHIIIIIIIIIIFIIIIIIIIIITIIHIIIIIVIIIIIIIILIIIIVKVMIMIMIISSSSDHRDEITIVHSLYVHDDDDDHNRRHQLDDHHYHYLRHYRYQSPSQPFNVRPCCACTGEEPDSSLLRKHRKTLCLHTQDCIDSLFSTVSFFFDLAKLWFRSRNAPHLG